MLLPLGASADDGDKTDTEKSNVLGGFGGTLIYENSVGKGVFTDSNVDDDLYSMSFSIRPHYVISQDLKLKLTVRMDFDVNIVESYASTNTRQNEVQFRDMQILLGWTDFVRLEAAKLYWSTSFGLVLPTSKLSDIQNKILGLKASLKTAYRPAEWFQLSYTFGATKNFNRYTNSVLDTSGFDAPVSTRSGGAEQVGEGLVAIGTSRSTEWSLTHTVTASFAYAGFGLDLSYGYYQYFVYDGASATAGSSSPYASSARGYRDLMRGVIEVSYTVNKYLSFALGTLTDQTPFGPNNNDLRFPFWDTSNGSDNRQSFYFDVVGSF